MVVAEYARTVVMSEQEPNIIAPGAKPVEASAIGLSMNASKYPGAIDAIAKAIGRWFAQPASKEPQFATLQLSNVQGQRFESYDRMNYSTVIVGENAVGNTVRQSDRSVRNVVIIDPAAASSSRDNLFEGKTGSGDRIKLTGREEDYRFAFLRGIELGDLRITHTPTGTDIGRFNNYETVEFDNNRTVSVESLCAKTKPCRTTAELSEEYRAKNALRKNAPPESVMLPRQTPISGGDNQNLGSGVPNAPEICNEYYCPTR